MTKYRVELKFYLDLTYTPTGKEYYTAIQQLFIDNGSFDSIHLTFTPMYSMAFITCEIEMDNRTKVMSKVERLMEGKDPANKWLGVTITKAFVF